MNSKNSPSPKTGAAYFGNRFLSHAQKDLARMADCCDYVVHTMSETDFYFHKSVMAQIFSATRRRGLEVWADPWGVGGVFGGEALSKFLLEHPDDWQVRSDGKRVPAACVNRRSFRDFMREWVLTVLDAGAQVIFWDEPHVHFHWNLEREGHYACVCPECRALFKSRFGEAMPPRLDNAASEFRRLSLRGFLEELMVFARKKGLRNALCLYAFEGDVDYDRIWTELASLPALDVFGCDPYWRWDPFRWTKVLSQPSRSLHTPAAYVKYFAERLLQQTRVSGKSSQVWIQAMRFPRGTEKEIAAACRAAVSAGVTHLAAWSYDGGALLDPVLAENPARVWAEVARAFKKIKSRR